MAYHGGPTSLPRAHRPRAPIMSVPAPLTAPLAPLRSTNNNNNHLLLQQQQQQTTSSTTIASATTTTTTSTSVPQVSLVTPRPDSERQSNEYVDTPFRVHIPVPPASSPPPPPRVQRPTRLPIPSPPSLPPVTKQPQPASFSKDPQVPPICDTRQSIICGECGRCRCPSCQQPRSLPECWKSTYHCSADTAIDYASCLCCVKGLFYHCSETDGGDTCVDQPCNCGPDRRTARWGCLAALSCVLPCLLFYWPLQCGKRVVEACYARHSRLGCRCRPKTTSGQVNTPEKRLLDVTQDF